MTFSEQEIRHIAQLARLQLTDKEIKQYRTELGGILRYVEQLQNLSLKTKELSKLSTENINLRHDQITFWPQSEIDVALQQAPHQKDRQIKVKRILE